MSEYILITNQPNLFLSIPATVAVVKPLVRCRDCEFFNDFHGLCHRPVLVVDGITNTRWVDCTDETEPIYATAAKPDGFCVWGERKSE